MIPGDPENNKMLYEGATAAAEFLDGLKNEICANLEIQAKANLMAAFVQPNKSGDGFIFDGETFSRAWDYLIKDYSQE